MPILDDESLRCAVGRTWEIRPGNLWEHLDCVARYFAMVGSVHEALHVWEIAYSGRLLIPGSGDDSAITSLCKHLNIEDLSKGKPRAKFIQNPQNLNYRIDCYDQYCRWQLTVDRWSISIDKGAIRKGLDLARAPEGKRYSNSEFESLDYLDEFLQTGRGEGPSTVLDILLLCSDIAYRHRQTDRSKEYLLRWVNLIGNPYTMLLSCFRLQSSAELMFKGTLSSVSSILPDESQSLIKSLKNMTFDREEESSLYNVRAVSFWRPFLIEFSARFLRDRAYQIEVASLPIVDFLGMEGASEQDILEAETKLAIHLPPSYRSFLSTSNGWAAMGDGQPGRLLPVQEIRRFSSLPAEAVDGLDADILGYSIEDHDKAWGISGQSRDIKSMLWNSFIISEWGDASILLLLPDYSSPGEEWLCVNYASWNPGFIAFDNFGAWFRRQFELISN